MPCGSVQLGGSVEVFKWPYQATELAKGIQSEIGKSLMAEYDYTSGGIFVRVWASTPAEATGYEPLSRMAPADYGNVPGPGRRYALAGISD